MNQNKSDVNNKATDVNTMSTEELRDTIAYMLYSNKNARTVELEALVNLFNTEKKKAQLATLESLKVGHYKMGGPDFDGFVYVKEIDRRIGELKKQLKEVKQ